MDAALELLAVMFSSLFEIVERLFDYFNILPYLLGAFFAITVFRLLLVPVIGGKFNAGTSDKAKKDKGDSDNG